MKINKIRQKKTSGRTTSSKFEKENQEHRFNLKPINLIIFAEIKNIFYKKLISLKFEKFEKFGKFFVA